MWKHISFSFLLLLTFCITSCSDVEVADSVTDKPVLTNAAVVFTKGVAIATPSEIANIGGAAAFCSAVNMPAKLNVIPANDTCQIFGTPDAATDSNGALATVIAYNSLGVSFADVTIRIDVPLQPNLQNLQAQVLKLHLPVQNTEFVNDGGRHLTSCDVSPAMPSKLEIAITDNHNSCRIIGTPEEQLVAESYTITATNSIGSNTATVALIIQPANDVDTPTERANLISPGLQNFLKDVMITAVDFVNTGGGATSCNPTPQLPAGLEIAVATIADTATCQITGTPTQLQTTTTYTVTASNSGGASSADISITVDLPAPPVLASPNPLAQIFVKNNLITNPVNFDNNGGVVTSCAVVGDHSTDWPQGLTIDETTEGASCQLTGTPTQLQVATAYTVAASNSGGSSRAAISITVHDTPPILASLAVQDYTIDIQIPTVNFGNTGGAVTGCDISPQLPAGLDIVVAAIAATATCQLTGTPTQLQAETLYTVIAANSGGDNSAAITITVHDTPPILASLAAQAYTKDVQILPVRFGDTGGAVTSCAVVGVTGAVWPVGLSVAATPDGASCQIYGIPTQLQDASVYTVTASNTAGDNSRATISITVNDTPPILASLAAQDYTIDIQIPTVNFGNTGGAVTSCAVAADNDAAWPQGLSFEPTPDGASCQLTGMPTQLQAETLYTVTAANSGGDNSAAISITVHDTPPILASLAAQDYTKDIQILPVRFGDTGGAVTSCAVAADNDAAWPVGLSVAPTPDGASCQISGIPTQLQDASIYTVTASNTAGGNSRATISITVNDRPPLLVSPSPQPFTINTTIPAVNFINIGGGVSSCNVVAPLPSGLQIAPATILGKATCQLTGRPTQLQIPTTYTVTASNSGGDNSADISITVHDRPPVLVSPSPQSFTINTPITTPVNFGNTGGTVTSCDVAPELPAGLDLAAATVSAIATCQLTGRPTQLQIPTTYTVTASNSGGDNSADISITVHDRPPVLVSPSPQSFTINTPITTPVNFGNTGGTVASCDVEPELPAGLDLAAATVSAIATCQLTGRPTQLQIPTTYTVTASNSGGDNSADISITVHDRPPVLVSPSPQSFTINTPITTPANFGNTGGTVASCDVAPELPAGLDLAAATVSAIATCQLTGRPTQLQTTTTYTVTASNSGGDNSADISITVHNIPPVLVSPSPQSFTINTPITTPVNFGNTGGTVASCDVAPELPAGLDLAAATVSAIATCQLTGRPTQLQIPTTYTVTASNSGGDSRATISITVNDRPPLLVSPSQQPFTINTTIPAVNFINIGGGVSSCNVVAPLPSGLQIAPATISAIATCQLTGRPTQLQIPTTYTVTASNSGGDNSADISITVHNIPPVLVSPSPQSFTINTPITTPANFGNTGGAVASCDVAPELPAGLDLAAATVSAIATCQLTGRPTQLQIPTTYTVTASNSGGDNSADISITVHDRPPVLVSPSPQSFTINTPITTPANFGNTGGTVTSCDVAPELPAGLDLAAATVSAIATCQLTGRPTQLQIPTTYTVTASNSGGDNSADISITVHNIPPVLVSPSPQSFTINTPITTPANFGNTGGAVASCDVAPELPAGLDLAAATVSAIATCQLTGRPTQLQIPTTYTVTASNSGGDNSADISITVHDRPPVLVSPSPQSFTINTPITTPVNFGNTGGTVASCDVEPELPAGLDLAAATVSAIATCQLTGRPTQLQIPTTYTVTASNSGGDNSADISITVHNIPPVLVSPSPQSFTINTPITTPANFGNTGGTVASCDVTPELPAGLDLAAATVSAIATCQLTGTPRQLQVETLYTVTASNSGGDNSADISITVHNIPPVLVSPSPQSFTINTPITTPANFGNTGGTVTSCDVAPELPAGLDLAAATVSAIATCQLTGRPTQLQIPTTYTVTASNSGGDNSADISITVHDRPPVLVSPSPQSFTINTPITTPVNFGNTGGTVASCDVAPELPAGLDLAAATVSAIATCQLTGRPTQLQIPTTYTVTASNSGGDNSADISITVHDRPPVLVSPSPQSFTINTPITTPVNFGNTGGTVASCDVEPELPAGLDLAAATVSAIATCQLTGRPTQLQIPTTYTVTASNSGGDNSADISITVHNIPPVLVSPSPQSFTINTPITTPANFGNTGGTVASCDVEPELPAGLDLAAATVSAIATCQLTGRPTQLQIPTTYTVTASNSGGDNSADISITVHNIPPVLVSPSPQSFTINTPITTPVNFGNTGGTVASCDVEPELPAGLDLAAATVSAIATCQLTGRPTQLQTTTTYTVTASNSGGDNSADISITVHNIPPVLVSPSPQSFTINTPITTPVNFGNTGGTVASCDVAPELPAGLDLAAATVSAIATCQLTGRPTQLQIPTTYTVTASNSGGDNSADISITVHDRPPVLVSPSPQSFTINTTIPAVNFINIGGGVSSCNVVAPLPSGLQIAPATILGKATCQLTGRPTQLQIPTTYTVTASNSGGDNSADISITVHDRPPVLVSPSPQSFTINTPITTPANFGNTGGTVASCDVEPELPAGLDLAAATVSAIATCQLTGRPTQLQIPTTYTVTASNSGGDNSADISITVHDRPPVLVSPSPQSFTINTPITTPANFGNTGGTVTSCDVAPELPAGLDLAAATVSAIATCQLTGRPRQLQIPTTYTVIASNSGGDNSADISITVHDRPPVLVSPSPQSFTINTTIPAVNFINIGGGVSSCNVVAPLPSGLQIAPATILGKATCQLTGTPRQLQIPTTYTVTASNSGGDNSADISITVHDRPPVLVSPSPQSFTINTPITTPANFGNTGGAVASCDVAPELPAGLDLAAATVSAIATCQLTGRPTQLQIPTTYTVTASNSGGDNSADISITVHNIPPVLVSPSPQSFTINTPITTPVNFGNTGGTVASCDVAPELPAGLDLAAATVSAIATCQLTGRPTQLQIPTTYTVTASNSGGDNSADISITVHNIPPVLVSPSPQSFTINTPITIPANFGNTGGTVASCDVAPELPAGLDLAAATVSAIATCQLTGRPTQLQIPTTYTVTASNSGGDNSADISITVHNIPPVLVSPSPQSFTINTPITTPVNFGNTGGAVASCDVAPELPAGLDLAAATVSAIATCQLTGRPTQLQIPTTYTVTASNSGGDNSADISITVHDRPPVLVSPSPQSFTINTPITTPANFGNTGGAVASCDVAPELPAGLDLAAATVSAIATCQLTGRPTQLQTPTTYTVTASNSGGDNSADISITVHNIPPVLVSPSPQSFTINTPITTPVNFGNTGGTVASCDVEPELPAGLDLAAATVSAIATCQLTGRPTQLQIPTTYTVTASNSGGDNSADISITVHNIPPVLVSPSPQSFTINTPITIPANFGNTGGTVASCDVAPELPAGLDLAAATVSAIATCQLTGRPTQLQIPTTYTVTASNSGGDNSADISITVHNIPPVLVSPSPQSFTINTPITTPVNFGNTGGAVASCDVAPELPAGLDLAAATVSAIATCQLTGRPTQLQIPTTYTVTASNSGGDNSADISITVHNIPPVLVSPSPQSFTINTPITTPVNFGNTGGTVASCDVAPELPAGLDLAAATVSAIATCQLTGRPTQLQIPTTYTVTASNSGGDNSADISITVHSTPPVLVSPSPQSFTINTPITTPVNFGNTGGAVASCDVAPELPAGLDLAAATVSAIATCQLTGTPRQLQVETLYTVTASHSGGNSHAAISITVHDIPPVLVSPSPQLLFTINAVIQTPANFGNTGGTVTSCDVEPELPAGLDLAAATISAIATCQLTGRPTQLQIPTTYTVTASNSGGNSSADISITVNDRLPFLVSPSPQSFTINTALTPPVLFGNTGGHVTRCEKQPYTLAWPEGLSFEPTPDGASCQISGTPTQLQNTSRYAFMVHNSGNSGNGVTLAIAVHDIPPILASLAAQDYTIDTQISDVLFGNTGGAVTSCAVVGDNSAAWPQGLSFAPTPDRASCQLTGIPTQLQAETLYTVIASNSGGDNSADISITVHNIPPVLVSPSPQSFTINTPITTPVNFGNSGGAVTSCNVSPQLPNDLELVVAANGPSCQITGTPTRLQAETLYTVTASNSGGASISSINIAVIAAIPVLESPTPQILTINTAILPVLFGNIGGAVTSCDVSSQLPAGLDIVVGAIAGKATCQLTGPPTQLQTTTTYTVTASNSGGDNSADISITVNANIPELASPSPQLFTINTLIPAVNFSNTGGAVTSCDVSAPLPSGLQLATIADTATCQITGTPTALQAEPITYTITASNSGGASRAAISITVNANIPELASPSPQLFTINTLIPVVNFSNTGGVVTSCNVSPQLPSDLQLAVANIADTATCQLTGTPTQLQAATLYTVTASNSGGDNSADISITVHDRPPVLVSPTTPQIFTKNMPIPTVNFINTGGDVTSCNVAPELPAGLDLTAATVSAIATCQLTGRPTQFQTASVYTVTAYNSDGRRSLLATPITITVHDISPDLTNKLGLIFNKNIEIRTPVRFDNTGGHVTQCNIVGDNSGDWPAGLFVMRTADLATCQIHGRPTQLQDEQVYTVAASNSGGTSNATIGITVNDSPPALVSPSPQTFTIDTPITPVIFGNSGGAAITRCTVVGVTGIPWSTEWGLTVTPTPDGSSCQISGYPTQLQEATTATYAVGAYNAGGHNSADISITVVNPLPPVLVSPSPQRFTIGTRIAPVIFGNSGGAAIRSCIVLSVNGSPWSEELGLSVTPTANRTSCQIYGIPSQLQEAATYAVRADNAGGDNSADILITVIDSPPVLDSNRARHLIFVTNTNSRVVIDYNGGEIINCTTEMRSDAAWPQGLDVTPTYNRHGCEISGWPSQWQVEEDYDVVAHNSGGHSSASISITIHDLLPILASPNPSAQIFVQNNPITPVLFGNTGGRVTNCEIVGDNSADWPLGLILNPTPDEDSCQITGTPSQLQTAIHYTVKADNSGYNIESHSASIEITVVDIPPVLASPSPQRFTMHYNITPVPFNNTGGRVTSCEKVGDNSADWPVGLNVVPTPDSSSCQISGYAAQLQEEATTYAVTATNSGGDSSATIRFTVTDIRPVLDRRRNLHLNLVRDQPIIERNHDIIRPGDPVILNTNLGAITDCTTEMRSGTAWPLGLRVYPMHAGSGCEISGTPTRWQTTADYDVVAHNSGGDSRASISITIHDIFPRLASPNPSAQIFVQYDPITPVLFGNTGGRVTSCEIVGDNSAAWPVGLTVVPTPHKDSCQVTGTPTQLQAAIQYTVKADNRGFNDDHNSASIEITVVDSPPVLASPSPQQFTIDTSITPVLFGNSGGAAITSCEIVGDNSADWPAGLNVAPTAYGTNCRILGIPSQLQGATTYTVTASNAGGDGSAAISITVVNPPPPVLASPSLQLFTIRTRIAAVIFGNSGGAAVTSCEIVGDNSAAWPAGLSVVPTAGGASCRIFGTPRQLQVATTYTVTASNAGGHSSADISLTVQGAAPDLSYSHGVMAFFADSVPQTIKIQNNGGAVTICTSRPPLPAGFAVIVAASDIENGANTCAITGTAVSLGLTSNTTYDITGSNNYVDVSTVAIQISVFNIRPSIANKIAQTILTTHDTQDTQEWRFTSTGYFSTCVLQPPQQLPIGLRVTAENGSCVIKGSPTQAVARAEYTVNGYISNAEDTLLTTATISITTVDSNCDTGSLISAKDSNPLERYQWYLDGRQQGQIAIGMDASKMDSSIHLNLQRAWRTDGCLGQGTLVSVVDTGLQITHPDLADNIDPRQGYAFATGSFMQPNAATGTTDPSPMDTDGDHGTAIAGLIAMVDNVMGGLGVAPKAKLLGFNNMAAGVNRNATYLQYSIGDATPPNATDSPAVDADIVYLGYELASRLDHIGTIHTAAIGNDAIQHPSYNEIIMRRIQDGRNGKGVIFVKPAGDSYIGDGDACSQANAIGTSCGLSGDDPIATLPIINVAAVNALGKRSRYSAAGAIWVSGLGGEQGGSSAGKPGMPTTDIASCDRGYSKASRSDHNFQFHSDDPICNYTNTFHGTRAAAAIVSGAVALLLSQHPALTIWDVRYILAQTATKIDDDYKVTTHIHGIGPYQFSRGWITNDADLDYSDWYGFGLVNVDAALAMAKSYSQLITHSRIETEHFENVLNDNDDKTVPNKNMDGLSSNVMVEVRNGQNPIVDHINLFIDLTATVLQDIEISLTSPAGTIYTAYPAGTGHTQANLNYDQPIAVNAFFGEKISGQWTITVKDLFSNDDFTEGDYAYYDDNTLNKWRLKFTYHSD